MMKKDELLEVLDLVLPAEAHREIFEHASKLCFRAKTVTGFNNDVAISVKFDTNSEGLLPGHELANILHSLKKDRIKFAYKGGDLVVNANKGRSISHGTLVYRGVGDDASIRVGRKRVKVEALDKDKFPDLEMWKPGNKWVDCPKDIIVGIASVLYDPKYPGNKFFIAGKYLIETDFEYRATGYRLSSPTPFDLAFHPTDVEILARFKDWKALRIAKHGSDFDGVIFDFGDFRVLVNRIALEKIKIPSGEGESIVATAQIEGAKKLFKSYYSNLVILPRELREASMRARIMSRRDYFTPLEIRISNGKICIRPLELKDNPYSERFLGAIEEEYPLEMDRPLPPIRFGVYLSEFARILSRANLMGYKTPKDPIYFRDKNLGCDHLITALDLQDSEGGS